ncbi:MAG: hypothetical protein NC400_07080 [Clostridium sp.]|nr:hypothetical protein [Clostridium sp.]
MKGKGGIIKALVVIVVLVGLVGGYYYYLSNKKPDKSKEEEVKATVVQEVLLRNLDNNYPPTPREVVKCFGELAQCILGETYTDDEFRKLALHVQKLYDAELIEGKTQQQYFEDLKWDINTFKEEGIVISSYTPASSVDVEEFTQNGYKCARLTCSFTLRKGTYLEANEEIFVLRKDEDGHWKILGWKPTENGNTGSSS